MARKIHARYLIQGTLTTRTPLHVGGHGESVETDLPLARDGAGRFYIPGTSLAGVLRDWCQQAFRNPYATLVKDLWGFQETSQNQQDNQGHASFITVADAPLPEDTVVEIRDGVGIDRVWGVAAEGIKYDRAVLPRGSRIPFAMTVDIEAPRLAVKGPQHSETMQEFEQRVHHTDAIIGYLLTSLTESRISVGAARTRGLGRVQFELTSLYRQRLDSREGIFELLKGGGAPVTVAQLVKADPNTHPQPQPRLDVRIRWQPCGPLMVKAGYEGIGIDMLPLVSAKDGGVALILPGSSIKGALRSQAERIVRTVLEKSASRLPNPRQRFLSQLDNIPLIQELFGTRSKGHSSGVDNTESDTPLPGRGALVVDDCYAREKIANHLWRQVEMAEAQQELSYSARKLWQVIDDINQQANGKFQLVESHHVAIDRWTGGAAQGMLFNVLTPMHTVWEDIRLTLDLQRLSETQRSPGLMLLFLTLRDLMQQRIPLGFATHRGMGDIRISSIDLDGDGLDNIGLTALTQVSLQDSAFQPLDDTLRETLTKAWQRWIREVSGERGGQ